MRAAIVSDIHSNLAALEATLADIDARSGVGELWNLGDIIGYGPDPVDCIRLIRKRASLSIVGNHDLAAIGSISTDDFNPHARAACLWNGKQLSGEDIAYLKALPQKLGRSEFTFVHGSPRAPVWEYIVDSTVATANFEHFDTRFCLVGHSHVPFVAAEPQSLLLGEMSEFPLGRPVQLGARRLIINPGSVGQPRNNDPRASYAIYDSEKKTVQRFCVQYDIEKTQKKMRLAGLPTSLIDRLSLGV